MSSGARELMVVARDTDDVKNILGNSNTRGGEHGQSYICDPETAKGVCYRGELQKGKNPAITHDHSYNDPIRSGVNNIDYVPLGGKWETTCLPDGFHVVNLQLAYHSNYSPKPRYFAYSKNKDPQYALGGTKIAEYIVFGHPLEETVRTNIYTALRTKWFNEPRTVRKFGNLTIGAGASMSIPWNDLVVTNCLTSGGDLKVASVKAAALRLTASDVNVSGSLELEDGATVTVEALADGSIASLSATELTLLGGGKVVFTAVPGVKPRVGETKILGSFTGSFSDWTVDASGITNVSVSLKEKEDGVYAVVSPKGTVLLVR